MEGSARHRHAKFAIVAAVLVSVTAVATFAYSVSISVHEDALAPEGDEVSASLPPPVGGDPRPMDPFEDWRRPDGPVRITLQAGHWKSADAPDEQENLRFNNAVGNGYSEWEVNLAIAEETRRLLLREHPEYQVDILPTTVPPDHYADVFVSIHADASAGKATRGYKVASARHDRTGDADRLAAVLAREYASATGLPRDPNLTSGMRGYYAFNWCKYEHALHPMTVGALLEMGFLTNPDDIAVIARDPARAARGIANGIVAYLNGQGATEEEMAAVTTIPEYVREWERRRAAERRADEAERGIVNPSDLIAPNANRPDDPWCASRPHAGETAP